MSDNKHLVVLQAMMTPEWVKANVAGEGAYEGAVVVSDYGGRGGLCGDMFLLTLADATPPREYVVKTFQDASLPKSTGFGLAREGLFLKHFVPNTPLPSESVALIIEALRPSMADVLYASGDLTTGKKLLVMSKLKGHLFSDLIAYDKENGTNGHPVHTREEGPEKDAIRAACGGVTEKDGIAKAFTFAARLHAGFWRREAVAGVWDFLHAREWVGPHRAASAPQQWQNFMDSASTGWKSAKEKGFPDLTIPPHFAACMEASLGKICYDTYMSSRVGEGDHWTLVHGDFHPSNVFYSTADKASPIKVFDFEMIGVGSGAQELGQFLISHSCPANRRKYEKELVCEVYYNEFKAVLAKREQDESCEGAFAGTVVPTVDQVWEEYKRGGVERWVWFIAFLLPLCPPNMNQYFINQVAAFMDDHITDPSSMGMPRV